MLNNSRITSAPRWPRRLRIRNPPLRPTTCSVVWMNLILFYFNHKMIEKVTLFRFTPFQIFLKQRFRKFTLWNCCLDTVQNHVQTKLWKRIFFIHSHRRIKARILIFFCLSRSWYFFFKFFNFFLLKIFSSKNSCALFFLKRLRSRSLLQKMRKIPI